LGESTKFDRAIERYALVYADQAEADHARLEAAIASGRIAAIRGI
jgi:hypothetical protein